MFKGRKLLIVSKHGKENVSKPLFEAGLGVECFVAPIDTDVLGTFTGEVKREFAPREAAVKKCSLAMEAFGGDLSFANEGSFGPHPYLPFTACDEELVVLVDKLNGLQIAERYVSMETNFSHLHITSWEELEHFANGVGFPSHRLILRTAADSAIGMSKGLNDWSELRKQYELLYLKYEQVYAETDMRAL